MFRKNKLAMLVGEFLGTFTLTLVVLALSHSQLSLNFFIAVSAGMLVSLMTVSLAGISGAVFNPAMTVGLWTVRKLRTLQALSYLAVQLVAGAVAWELFVYFTKLNTIHNTGTFNARVMVGELVGTGVFAFAWASAIYQRLSLSAKALTIGGGLTVGALIASLGSAGVLNPAVALGLRQWGWGTYVLGPVLGAIIGFNLYNLLFVETELAEVAESRDEKAKTSGLNATLTQSEVAAAATPARRSVGAKARTTAAKKPAAKKTTAKRATSSRRRNPNAA